MIETSAAGFTVNVADPFTEPMVTPMAVFPELSVVVSPAVPVELLMVAIVAAEELQCPEAVRSWVVLSV